jgi:hypothetical protein
MVYLTGKYGTRHPKDIAARRIQETARLIKENGCTRRELHNPTESNIRKCMAEMKYTAGRGEQFKKDAKFLGESTNLDRHRRAR